MLPAMCRPWTLTLCLLLAACGGGGNDTADDPGLAAGTCSVAEQNAWLASYFDDWYFWSGQAPRPAPAGYASVSAYFEARRYTGGDGVFPADRWSYEQSSADFNRTFGEGATLGYGVAVSGIEAAGVATRPLWVRYVDPGSPAAVAGVMRGDRVLSLNGRPAAELVAAQDYGALVAASAGSTLSLVLERAGVARSLTLSAAVYPLVPVARAELRRTPAGRSLGVLQVQQMISPALAPLDAAFAQFRSAGVADLVLDLRYNGGGLVSTGATLASYIAGTRGAGLAYARLIYNASQRASDSSFAFSQPGSALSLPRVFVLGGPRTCSASEQVVNGLRGAGVEVVLVGNTTCGKPVGFQPRANCGRTYSIVNFESVNARGEGRYVDGLAATCVVDEDFSAEQNGDADPLLAAAAAYADQGQCPASTTLRTAGPRARALRDGGGPMEMMAR